MFRSLLCVSVAMFCCADVALAAKGNKAPRPTIGTIKSVDKDKLTVTVTVPGNKKKAAEDKDFTVPDGVMVSLTGTDGTTKDVAVKDALKDPLVATGATIKVTTSADGTVTKVEIGGEYKGKKKKAA